MVFPGFGFFGSAFLRVTRLAFCCWCSAAPFDSSSFAASSRTLSTPLWCLRHVRRPLLLVSLHHCSVVGFILDRCGDRLFLVPILIASQLCCFAEAQVGGGTVSSICVFEQLIGLLNLLAECCGDGSGMCSAFRHAFSTEEPLFSRLQFTNTVLQASVVLKSHLFTADSFARSSFGSAFLRAHPPSLYVYFCECHPCVREQSLLSVCLNN